MPVLFCHIHRYATLRKTDYIIIPFNEDLCTTSTTPFSPFLLQTNTVSCNRTNILFKLSPLLPEEHIYGYVEPQTDYALRTLIAHFVKFSRRNHNYVIHIVFGDQTMNLYTVEHNYYMYECDSVYVYCTFPARFAEVHKDASPMEKLIPFHIPVATVGMKLGINDSYKVVFKVQAQSDDFIVGGLYDTYVYITPRRRNIPDYIKDFPKDIDAFFQCTSSGATITKGREFVEDSLYKRVMSKNKTLFEASNGSATINKGLVCTHRKIALVWHIHRGLRLQGACNAVRDLVSLVVVMDKYGCIFTNHGSHYIELHLWTNETLHCAMLNEYKFTGLNIDVPEGIRPCIYIESLMKAVVSQDHTVSRCFIFDRRQSLNYMKETSTTPGLSHLHSVDFDKVNTLNPTPVMPNDTNVLVATHAYETSVQTDKYPDLCDDIIQTHVTQKVFVEEVFNRCIQVNGIYIQPGVLDNIACALERDFGVPLSDYDIWTYSIAPYSIHPHSFVSGGMRLNLIHKNDKCIEINSIDSNLARHSCRTIRGVKTSHTMIDAIKQDMRLVCATDANDWFAVLQNGDDRKDCTKSITLFNDSQIFVDKHKYRHITILDNTGLVPRICMCVIRKSQSTMNDRVIAMLKDKGVLSERERLASLLNTIIWDGEYIPDVVLVSKGDVEIKIKRINGNDEIAYADKRFKAGRCLYALMSSVEKKMLNPLKVKVKFNHASISMNSLLRDGRILADFLCNSIALQCESGCVNTRMCINVVDDDPTIGTTNAIGRATWFDRVTLNTFPYDTTTDRDVLVNFKGLPRYMMGLFVLHALNNTSRFRVTDDSHAYPIYGLGITPLLLCGIFHNGIMNSHCMDTDSLALALKDIKKHILNFVTRRYREVEAVMTNTRSENYTSRNHLAIHFGVMDISFNLSDDHAIPIIYESTAGSIDFRLVPRDKMLPRDVITALTRSGCSLFDARSRFDFVPTRDVVTHPLYFCNKKSLSYHNMLCTIVYAYLLDISEYKQLLYLQDIGYMTHFACNEHVMIHGTRLGDFNIRLSGTLDTLMNRYDAMARMIGTVMQNASSAIDGAASIAMFPEGPGSFSVPDQLALDTIFTRLLGNSFFDSMMQDINDIYTELNAHLPFLDLRKFAGGGARCEEGIVCRVKTMSTFSKFWKAFTYSDTGGQFRNTFSALLSSMDPRAASCASDKLIEVSDDCCVDAVKMVAVLDKIKEELHENIMSILFYAIDCLSTKKDIHRILYHQLCREHIYIGHFEHLMKEIMTVRSYIGQIKRAANLDNIDYGLYGLLSSFRVSFRHMLRSTPANADEYRYRFNYVYRTCVSGGLLLLVYFIHRLGILLSDNVITPSTNWQSSPNQSSLSRLNLCLRDSDIDYSELSIGSAFAFSCESAMLILKCEIGHSTLTDTILQSTMCDNIHKNRNGVQVTAETLFTILHGSNTQNVPNIFTLPWVKIMFTQQQLTSIANNAVKVSLEDGLLCARSTIFCWRFEDAPLFDTLDAETSRSIIPNGSDSDPIKENYVERGLYSVHTIFSSTPYVDIPRAETFEVRDELIYDFAAYATYENTLPLINSTARHSSQHERNLKHFLCLMLQDTQQTNDVIVDIAKLHWLQRFRSTVSGRASLYNNMQGPLHWFIVSKSLKGKQLNLREEAYITQCMLNVANDFAIDLHDEDVYMQSKSNALFKNSFDMWTRRVCTPFHRGWDAIAQNIGGVYQRQESDTIAKQLAIHTSRLDTPEACTVLSTLVMEGDINNYVKHKNLHKQRQRVLTTRNIQLALLKTARISFRNITISDKVDAVVESVADKWLISHTVMKLIKEEISLMLFDVFNAITKALAAHLYIYIRKKQTIETIGDGRIYISLLNMCDRALMHEAILTTELECILTETHAKKGLFPTWYDNSMSDAMAYIKGRMDFEGCVIADDITSHRHRAAAPVLPQVIDVKVFLKCADQYASSGGITTYGGYKKRLDRITSYKQLMVESLEDVTSSLHKVITNRILLLMDQYRNLYPIKCLEYIELEGDLVYIGNLVPMCSDMSTNQDIIAPFLNLLVLQQI